MTADQALVAACLEGTGALRFAAGRVTDWGAPTPCDRWTAQAVAAHVRATSARYQRLLDAAIAGSPEPVARGADLAALNDRDIAALPRAAGPEHVARFADDATRYALRLCEHWEVRPYMDGWPVSAGDHAAVVAAEWHIHAWDLARASGGDHRPEHPEIIVAGWRAAVNWIPVGDGEPWAALLVASGRDPGWAPNSAAAPPVMS